MRKMYYAVAPALTLLVLCGGSCKGRHADDTPNGETVEVVIEPVQALQADTTAMTEDVAKVPESAPADTIQGGDMAD